MIKILILILLSSLLILVNSGYIERSLRTVIDIIKTFHDNFINLNILEFGNQKVPYESESLNSLYNRYNYIKQGETVKSFFNHLGMNHISIDINGIDGALSYDCRKSITSLINERFHIITNIGFSEHVGEGDIEENLLNNQYAYFKNAHDLGMNGCTYINEVPAIGDWYQHGIVHYNMSFFKDLAKKMNYDIISLYIYDFGIDNTNSIFAIYQKVNDNEFISFDEFKELQGLQSIYSDYENLDIVLYFDVEGGNERIFQFSINTKMKEYNANKAATEYCYIHLNGILLYNLSPDYKTDEQILNECVRYVEYVIEQHSIEKNIKNEDFWAKLHIPLTVIPPT